MQPPILLRQPNASWIPFAINSESRLASERYRCRKVDHKIVREILFSWLEAENRVNKSRVSGILWFN